MGAHIEPALLAGELVYDDGGETLGQWDEHDGIDTPIERLADHAGIDLEQAAAALDWMRQQQREDVFEEAAALLGRLFDILLPRRNPKTEILPKLETLGIKLLAVRIMLNRDDTTTLTQWAQRAGASKQLLSWHIKSLEDSTQLHWLGGKKYESRAVYAAAAKERWAALTPEERIARRHGKKPAQSTTPAA